MRERHYYILAVLCFALVSPAGYIAWLWTGQPVLSVASFAVGLPLIVVGVGAGLYGLWYTEQE